MKFGSSLLGAAPIGGGAVKARESAPPIGGLRFAAFTTDDLTI